MQTEIKAQLKEAESVNVELSHYDIGEYRFDGRIVIETEDYDIHFDLFATETGKTVDYGRDNPSEWESEQIRLEIDNIKAYSYEEDKYHTIVDNQIEKLLKEKVELC